jgi:predicted nucleotidyltransferase
MISKDTIQEVTNRLVNVYNPIEIYLFGSYAWGNPTEDSDLDLLVVVEESDEKSHKRSIKAAEALWDLKIPKDLLIYTKKEFVDREEDITTLIYKIKKDGKVLYARS